MSDTALQPWPVNDNVSFINQDEIIQYLHVIFGGVEWNESRWINLRGIGEKGTRQEGKFQQDIFLSPLEPGCRERIFEAATRFARHHVAFFCAPCVLREQRGTAANVELFTVLIADLDTGDTNAKLQHMADHMGHPTMVVSSGGVTDLGTDKVHVYYKLDVPSDDIQGIVGLRDLMAKKCGGDSMFGLGVKSNPYGRAHQPIRVAGTCHAKHAKPRSVRILHLNENQIYTLEGLAAAIESMPFGPWFTPEEVEKATVDRQTKLSLSFGPEMESTAAPAGSIDKTLTQAVYEGGDDVTRWGEFSKVAGHYVRMIREGRISAEEALESTQGWTLANMKPAWPPGRVDKEFWAIHSKDLLHNGPMPKLKTAELPAPDAPPAAVAPAQTYPNPHIAPSMPSDNGLLAWAAWRWVKGPKPEHKFLVDRLLIQGEPHLFVGEGGCGKTYQILDLGLKVAAYERAKSEGIDLFWNGQKVVGGGTVIEILNEDSKNEIHIRLMEIDSQNLINAAGDNLIPLPMSNIVGTFPLVERDSKTGQSISSVQWSHLLASIKAICPNPALVIIDTFNSVAHGDENAAIATNEMMREAKRVCSELGAALVITHHLRKPKGDQPIRSLEELGEAIRGSSAIVSAFRICFGMFKAIDYDRRMKAMGLKPVKNAMWRFGIAKANINGLMRGEKTLLRAGNGMLEDCTDADKFNAVNGAERMAWLVLAIRLAARNGHPYASGGKNAKNGLYARRAEMPSPLKKIGASEFSILVENALQEGLLVVSAFGGKDKKWLDEPGGLIATNDPDAAVNEGSYTPPEFGDFIYRPGDCVVLHKDEQPLPFQNGIGPEIPTAPEGIENVGLWQAHMAHAAQDMTPPKVTHMKGAKLDD